MKYKCLCCGYYTLGDIIYDICPVCRWGDESDAFHYPYTETAFNGITLSEARDNYKKYGVSDRRYIDDIRPPRDDELYGIDQYKDKTPDEVMVNGKLKYACQCCGFYTMEIGWYDSKDRDETCPVCMWKKSNKQLLERDLSGYVNTPSLNKAQENFQKFGAIEECYMNDVRPPHEDELISTFSKGLAIHI